MKISTQQIEQIQKGEPIAKHKVEAAVIKLTDADLVADVTAKVNAMPDREDMIADLKARIEAGNYNPTGEEITETMIRRAIADRIKE
ncbi:MAG: flagellar biosynthesis anti-sigma factor FlgM [Fimbriimonadaceae bacterium]|nr:MAG: flagellar biosynthesis anti-sigma factor FlgM [Fimbriimonadaceae bacterium]